MSSLCQHYNLLHVKLVKGTIVTENVDKREGRPDREHRPQPNQVIRGHFNLSL